MHLSTTTRAGRRAPAILAILCLCSAAPFTQEPWIESKSAHFSVFYQAGFEDDARRVRTWAEDAERLMKEKYGVDMLAPSAPAMKSATAISSLGLPKSSDDYHAKILMSEYIPIGHYEAQNARPSGGWKYYSAPNWFVQGLQEYDAIFHTTTANRDVTAKRLSAWATAHRAAFSCCTPDFAIADDYNGGAAFMTFLAVQFGEGVHARLLRSGAPTFADALTEETKPYTRNELFLRLTQWLKNGAPPRS